MKNSCLCNNCEKEFIPQMTHETIGKDKNGGDVVQSYFICPHCGHRYNSLITDSVYKKMLAKYREYGRAVVRAAKENSNQAKLKALVCKMNNYEEKTMKPYYAQMKKYWQTESQGDDTVAK